MKTIKKTAAAAYYTNRPNIQPIYNNGTNFDGSTIPHITRPISGHRGPHASIGSIHYSPTMGYKGSSSTSPHIKNILKELYTKYSKANFTKLNKIYNNAKPKAAAAKPRLTTLEQMLENEQGGSNSNTPMPRGYKKGGKIPKAGLYKLHKGEVIVPASRVKTVDKALRDAGKKPLVKKCKSCLMTSKQVRARARKL